jgi:hypothetical protein
MAYLDQPAGPGVTKVMETQPVDMKGGLDSSLNQAASIDYDHIPEGAILDSYGLPLMPQPSTWRDDPLVNISLFWTAA